MMQIYKLYAKSKHIVGKLLLLNVDAVVYWIVWDVEKAALEVQEYQKAIEHITQTGLKYTIGKHELSVLLQECDKIAEDL